MPTTLPHKAEDQEGGIRHSSPTRLVHPENLRSPSLPTEAAATASKPAHVVTGLRLRADSDGSTNNAFFRRGTPPLPPPPAALVVQAKKEQRKRRNNQKKKPAKEDGDEIEAQEGHKKWAARKKTRKAALNNKSSPHGLETIYDTSVEDIKISSSFEHNANVTQPVNKSLRFPNPDPSSTIFGTKLLTEEDTTEMEHLLSNFLRESSGCEEPKNYASLSSSNSNNNATNMTSKKNASSKKKDKTTTSLLYTLSNDDDEDMDMISIEDFDDEYPAPSRSKQGGAPTVWDKLTYWFDPSPWLISDVKFNDAGTPYFDPQDEWNQAGFFRHFLYNPIAPEFTSLQQFVWAVIIGMAMGVFSAFWKILVESGIEFVWATMPEILLERGVFTDLDGAFPLYHYMWIVPMIFGGTLACISCVLPVPIPGQNEWIQNLHVRGVQDYRTFFPLFVLATLGMISGLSLGPELPLVLAAGMFGSWLGIACHQSMLQARVLNLTAASAAVGGFFGFPMAGALFVLELPHRMGLQYFEALSPATISSIIAVIFNRIITNNEVTGYFKYPFLSTSLPSQIFHHAIFYGLYGAGIGIIYAFCVIKVKAIVRDCFHDPHDHHTDDELHIDDDGSLDYHLQPATNTEQTPLVEKKTMSSLDKRKSPKSERALKHSSRSFRKGLKNLCCCVIPYEPIRAALAGSIAGAMCGVIAIFVPHTLFWGEAQLQNLIDKGRTPLPVFGQGNDTTADLTALGYCLIDPTDEAAIQAGFSMECSILLMVSKTIAIGLSLGTGIIGGHFWGPMFIGCAASHFLSDLIKMLDSVVGFGGSLAAYPCLIILCVMGSAHVVTFRAHTAIMLILTLTISSFSPEDGSAIYSVAGDYSAVFPLLVISVFVSLMVSRTIVVFYKEQRSRGDIMAVPEVLCEPGMDGRPLVQTYDAGNLGDEFDDFEEDEDCGNGRDDDDNDDDDGQDELPYDDGQGGPPSHISAPKSRESPSGASYRAVLSNVTAEDIEKAFSRENSKSQGSYRKSSDGTDPYENSLSSSKRSSRSNSKAATVETLSIGAETTAFSRLDVLLSAPVDAKPENAHRASPNSLSAPPKKANHRRSQSASAVENGRMLLNMRLERKDPTDRFESPTPTTAANRERANSRGSRNSVTMRVESFGELQEHQPPLLEQARLRAASRELIEVRKQQQQKHRRSPSMPDRPTPNTAVVAKSPSFNPTDIFCYFDMDEIEESFNAVFNLPLLGDKNSS